MTNTQTNRRQLLRIAAAVSTATALPFAWAQASSAASAPAAEAVLAPNANLVVQNIPPIPMSISTSLARYSDFRGHRFVAWHPKQQHMLVGHRAKGESTAQLFWLKSPMGALEPVTKHPDPVGSATLEPNEGAYIVYDSSKGGSEAFQLFKLDPGQTVGTQITSNDFRHSNMGWLRVNGKPTGQLIVSRVPLDRTLSAEQRASIGTSYFLLDPTKPEATTPLVEFKGIGWFGASFNRAGTQFLTTRYISANESEVWQVEVASGKQTKILPAAGDKPGVHFPGRYTRDGKGIFFLSDRNGEFRELMHLELATGKTASLTAKLPYDVEGASEDDDEDDEAGKLIYTRFNVRGKSELRAFDSTTFAEVPLKGLPEGSVGGARMRRNSTDIAMGVNNARSPGDIHVWDSKTQQAKQWSRAESPMDTSGFKEQSIITWKSFDGLEISGLINRASDKFKGKRPVLIDIHGGPEAQARVGFMGRANYYINELGITVIQPNVRGSSGFGKTFLALDNGFKREDSVKDIGALLDWIATQPDLDASRVLVAGGSYGGYMSLAVSQHYADRIAGAVDVVGISNFVTFLETTESYRRDLRRSEYGDERDPKMREHLIKISPTTNAAKIKKPLLVVQGKNDPRVPYTEAEQIVEIARKAGATVWYLRAENEGHGFARKENADFYAAAMVRFMQETVLK
jgi:dipeptidyl aminopeptidase/acylaminoacyl peptidase